MLLKSILALIFSVTTTVLATIERNDFINENVEITTTLSTSNVHQDIKVSAKALETSGIYYLSFPKSKALDENLAFIQVKGGAQGRGKQLLRISRGTGKNNAIYRVDIGRGVEVGKIVELEIKLVWIGIAPPFPKEISQKDTDQKFDYHENAHLYSPYKTKQLKHIVSLPTSKEPLSWEKDNNSLEPAVRSGSRITYGPYNDIKSFSNEPFRIHFFDSNAPLVAKKYKKTIKVSYWTPELHVQEDFDVYHNGASLKGHFSQIDFKLTQFTHGSTSVVKSMTANLPAEAKDVFYKDAVGNVTTSNLRKEKSRTLLELRPRFPLYGGWKTSWFHGYTIPNYPVLQKKSDEYTFEMSMSPSIKNIFTERAFLEVILPEGAENVKVVSPYSVDKETHSRTFTYFDTIGRPTVLIEKSKLVDEYFEPIKITYTYSSSNAWRKPTVIAGSVIAFFIVFITITSLDLSIVQDPAVVLKKKLAAARSEISVQVIEERKLIARLSFAFSTYKSNKNRLAFEPSRESLLQKIEECQSLIANGEYSFNDTFFKNCKQLASLLKSRSDNLKKTHDAVIAFFESGDSEDGRKKLANTLESLENALEAANEKITAFLEII